MWEMKDKARLAEKQTEHRELMNRFAEKIVERRLTAPAILFLESVKPLSFLGNQALVFFQPIVHTVFAFKTYDEITEILEDRENLEYLLTKVEELEAAEKRKQREEKKRRKEARKAAKTLEEGNHEK